jgi:hypothetical protein
MASFGFRQRETWAKGTISGELVVLKKAGLIFIAWEVFAVV